VDELTVDPDIITQTHEVERLLEEWLHNLSEREQAVLEGRFGLHEHESETLETISARLGLTRERVRQIQNEALLKLKRHLARRGIMRDDLL
jgi:RNA polymerase nonessential primary-like sigma factor